MDAKGAIEASFKEIIKRKPYGKISISEVCEHAGVSRKAFYAHFQNKEAIVSELFDKHVVKRFRDIHSILGHDDRVSITQSSLQSIYDSLFSEREYYLNLVRPMRGQDDTFIRVVTNALYELNRKSIPVMDRIEEDWEQDYVAYFFASSQAMLIQKWISDKMAVSPAQLAGLYSSITLPFWWNLSEWQR